MPQSTPSTSPLQNLQASLCYTFANAALLELALTHPSCAQENAQAASNQRLEFLGDAVLGFILADTLYHSRPDDREGVLTQARSQLASGKQLAKISQRIGIAQALRMSAAERDQGGHLRAGALEDALEAVIGAIYLDGGLQAARASVLHCFGDIEQLLEHVRHRANAKGRLQEHLQGQGLPTPDYQLIRSEGPDHQRTYHVEVWFGGKCHGSGEGPAIKAAEEQAAQQALRAIEQGD